MSLPFSTEEYYQKVIQLQEKLRQSEEERLKLEMKYNEMIQVMKEEEELHFKKLRTKYKQFLDEDRRRQQRNDKILDALERIESRAQIWKAKSEKFKEFKKRYRLNSVPPSNFGKKDVNDERPDIKTGVIDNYLNSISTRPKETVQSPSENKYLNLASVNSAAYWKEPKDAAKYDIEKTSSEYDFSYSPLKSTKNFENSLKQNNPLPFRSYDYSEHEDPLTNDTPIATTLEVHNTLRRLLKDDVPHDPEKTATGKGLVKSFTENRTLSDLNKPKNNTLISHINGKITQTPIATKSKIQFEIPEDSRVGNFESSTVDSHKSPQIEREVVNSNVIQSYKEVIEELPIMIEEQKFVENLCSIEATDIDLKTDTVEPGLVRREEDHSKTISQEGEDNEPELRQPDRKFSEENRSNSTNQEDEDLRPPDSKRSEGINEQQIETKTLQQNHNDAIDPSLSNEHHHQELEKSSVEEDPVKSGTQNTIEHSGEYDDSREPLNQIENKQFVQQYDENGQPLHYDENGQHLQQYDDNGQPQYYPDVDPQYYNQSGEYAQYDEHGQLLMQQYDEHGQLLQQYDENGQPLQQYYNSDGLQYDEQGQPILQYDENGQPLLHYDENGQPIGHYDENGQPIGHYDENGQLVAQYDENGQLMNYDAGLDYNENIPQQQYEENNFQQPEQVEPNAEPVQVQDDNGGSQGNNSQDLETQENVQPDPPSTVAKE
ncbi:hypothetical protein RI129_003737 [Pyrocoelia pectoralis]|uniref:Uncharacterized protein n=1 Tax=Pyrocoelia pectoralis TaxID=417401 RepID=A0AAN7ZIV7_9COLE